MCTSIPRFAEEEVEDAHTSCQAGCWACRHLNFPSSPRQLLSNMFFIYLFDTPLNPWWIHVWIHLFDQPINISNVGGSSRPPELFSAFRRGLGLCTASPHRAGRGLATAHGAPCPLAGPLGAGAEIRPCWWHGPCMTLSVFVVSHGASRCVSRCWCKHRLCRVFMMISHVICAHDRVWLARMVFGQFWLRISHPRSRNKRAAMDEQEILLLGKCIVRTTCPG